MNYEIRPVEKSDLESIVAIEAAAFDMPIEMTRKDMLGRIDNYPDTFLVAAVDGQVVGHVFGPAAHERYIKDVLYYDNHENRSADPYQTVLSLAVAEQYRKNGIATALLAELSKVAASEHRKAVTLTCLPKLFDFYEKRGFVNEGPTADDIPEASFNMVKTL